ncbi:hypothetical protein RhiirA5_437295 [Rhizophagus irregularis]|uniref:Uncharacterized protein n=1 Tax=Rhizophagus irregularis TaxID=588596 RepID=A0A2N0NKQ4_9GLOM|nr:hypothetical protein RhiirA5_437295 [Rhizophagus irregularis]
MKIYCFCRLPHLFYRENQYTYWDRNHFEEGLKPLRVFYPKISDACYTKINKKLSAKINKVNSHCTAEIASINARIENFVIKAQSILDRINNIEQIVNDLYEEKKHCEKARIVNQPETAQGQNDTESITSSVNSSSNAPSEGVSYNIGLVLNKLLSGL